MKTSNLIDAPLDWAVAKCEGLQPAFTTQWITPRSEDTPRRVCVINELVSPAFFEVYEPTTNWWKGGPIIEREKISVMWRGFCDQFWATCDPVPEEEEAVGRIGPTILIAAMRCYVASKLGDEIDIPKELL